MVQNIDKTKDYQKEVKRRLREKKLQEETHIENSLEYMASMLPSAIEMHKFIKIMSKHQFEHEGSYKIATKIQTFRDKERLEFLLNN